MTSRVQHTRHTLYGGPYDGLDIVVSRGMSEPCYLSACAVYDQPLPDDERPPKCLITHGILGVDGKHGFCRYRWAAKLERFLHCALPPSEGE